jgi:hypothetical protein
MAIGRRIEATKNQRTAQSPINSESDVRLFAKRFPEGTEFKLFAADGTLEREWTKPPGIWVRIDRSDAPDEPTASGPCPECGQQIEVPVPRPGTFQTRCPTCKEVISVPAPTVP